MEEEALWIVGFGVVAERCVFQGVSGRAPALSFYPPFAPIRTIGPDIKDIKKNQFPTKNRRKFPKSDSCKRK
jgi:hypothetical protein